VPKHCIHHVIDNLPDLKSNILISPEGQPYLTDPGLAMIVPDPILTVSSRKNGGSIEWTSPELLKGGPPTTDSDCYALGMVIYEVLSGKAPFAQDRLPITISNIFHGKRPEKPEGELFTEGIWELLELCWKAEPSERISADGVLQTLTPGNPGMFSLFYSTHCTQ